MSGETTQVVNFPNPPRLGRDVEQNQMVLARWTEDFYRASLQRFQNTEARLDRATVLEPIEELADTATLDDVIAKSNEQTVKINAIIAALAFSVA